MPDTANIAPRGCHVECRETWRHEHGAACPGGPFPGTMADEGDVRRCEHGRVWLYRSDSFHPSTNFDLWERLTWWGTPIRYRRAIRALSAPQEDDDA